MDVDYQRVALCPAWRDIARRSDAGLNVAGRCCFTIVAPIPLASSYLRLGSSFVADRVGFVHRNGNVQRGCIANNRGTLIDGP